MPSGRYLFVSDLHLDASAPDAIAQFVAFLRGEARTARALYILGDLFESWVGDDDAEPARTDVCNELRTYTAAGYACYVMRGNRDFLLGAGFEARTGCKLLPDPCLMQAGPLRVLLSHGDLLCTADHSYQEFRSMVRQPVMQARYLRLPVATRRALANAARSGSKQHTYRTAGNIMDVNTEAVAKAFAVADCALLIHGHTHRAAVHDVALPGRTGTRIVLGDWYEQGSCLTLQDDGTHELRAIPRGAGASGNAADSNSRV
jgi:UDP-2,3-diacylglucosamine hydrolase